MAVRRLDFAQWASLSLAVALGCGSQPVPLVAVEGTTITLAIPASFPTGFGTAWVGLPSTGGSNPPAEPAYDPASLLEDPQRGELQFRLYDDTDALLRILPVRLITDVYASPSSIGGSIYTDGQALAFLDIPVLTEVSSDADYRIRIHRVRRKPGSIDPTNGFEEVLPQPLTTEDDPWTGWGDDAEFYGSADFIPIHIKKHDGQEHFTPLKGWEDVAGTGLSNGDIDPEELVPYPEFQLRVPEIGSTEDPPAAWEIELAFPLKKLRIRDVSLLRGSRSEAMVRWDAPNPDAVVACSNNLPGILKIRVVDPDQATTGVVVAYQLRNFEDTCGARASDLDFGEWPGTFRAWDADGNEITSTVGFEVDASSFL